MYSSAAVLVCILARRYKHNLHIYHLVSFTLDSHVCCVWMERIQKPMYNSWSI